MLKKIFLLTLTVVSYTAQVYADGIVFHDMTLPEAQAKAKEEGKLVFVDCYTPWCGPCKAMAKNIFPLDSCGEYMNPRFVSVMKDLEAEDNVYIAEKYDVKIYPTFLILRPDGSLYHRIVGGAVKTAGKFIDRVENALKIGSYETRFADGERGGEFMVEYVSALDPRSPKEIIGVLDRYIPGLTVSELGSETSLSLIGMIPSTDCASFRHVFDNRAKLATTVGADKVSGLVVGAYRKEFAGKRMNPGFDFSGRLADLSAIRNEGGEIPGFLYESMLFRDVINKKDASRIGDVVSAIEVIGNTDGPESAKLDALSNLRGYVKTLGADDSAPIGAALGKIAVNMSANARRSVEKMQ